MIRRFFIPLFVAILLAYALSACDVLEAVRSGQQPNDGTTTNRDDTPEAAVQTFLEAAFLGDVETMLTLTCAASMATVETSAQAFSSFSQSGAEIDFSGMTYTAASNNGDTATVAIGGTIVITMAGTTTEQPVDGSMPEIPVVREDNAWKVCGL